MKNFIVSIAFWALGLIVAVLLEYVLYVTIETFYELPQIAVYAIGFLFGFNLIFLLKEPINKNNNK